MSIVGTFSGPPAPTGGSASANEYNTIQELLYKLPDNDANLIQAKDIRDGVYTLWERIEDVSIVASQSSIITYSSATPSTATNLVGFPVGTTFSNVLLQDMWDTLLHPYNIPTLLLDIQGNDYREYGAPNSVQLDWSVSSTLLPISIDLVGTPIIPSGLSMSGTTISTATQNQTTTFSMTVIDSHNTYIISDVFTWKSAIYWGKTPTFTLPSMIVSGSQPAWADGASYSNGKLVTDTFCGFYNGINGGGEYLTFAWPTTYGEPTFVVNGLINNAFTKLGIGVTHSNQYGYVSSYDVWLSDTIQNSSITSFEIK